MILDDDKTVIEKTEDDLPIDGKMLLEFGFTYQESNGKFTDKWTTYDSNGKEIVVLPPSIAAKKMFYTILSLPHVRGDGKINFLDSVMYIETRGQLRHLMYIIENLAAYTRYTRNLESDITNLSLR